MRALAALALALLFAGCTTDAEDRAFFARGWLKPEQGANLRLYGTPKEIDLDKPQVP